MSCQQGGDGSSQSSQASTDDSDLEMISLQYPSGICGRLTWSFDPSSLWIFS